MIPILGISVWLIAKVFVVLFLILYVIFALVVIRQVKLMVDTIEVGFELPLKLIAFLHLVFAFIVLLIALTAL